ncbi:hypothetical protein GJ496_010777 [Pomphorhynchus laevis]|nr:hypothetical protein GJ496_010777 [Pomphorhynchus laevis]
MSSGLRDLKSKQLSSESSSSVLDTHDFKFDTVEIDAVVIMKIIKHTNDEKEEAAMGSLVGLINNHTLEVTNCFALPLSQHAKPVIGLSQQQNQQLVSGQSAKFEVDMEQYQSTMISFFREAKLDYMQVGFYQCVTSDNMPSAEYLTAMYDYHSRESADIAVFYDPWKFNNGFIHLKAFRLTRKARDAGHLYEMTPEKIASLNLIFSNLFEELPILIKKSPLTNLYIDQLSSDYPSDENHLLANTPLILERDLSELYNHLDQYGNECYILGQYTKLLRIYNQQKEVLIHQRQKDNELRKQRGEPPLPEDISNLLPQFPIPDRKKSFLNANDVIKSCNDLHQLLIQSHLKLFTLQDGLSK